MQPADRRRWDIAVTGTDNPNRGDRCTADVTVLDPNSGDTHRATGLGRTPQDAVRDGAKRAIRNSLHTAGETDTLY